MTTLFLDVVSSIPEFHVINENKIIHSLKIIQNNQKLSDTLIPAYLEINKKFNFHKNLKKIIITIGPGSYTALRVGASFIAGISYSMDLPISFISTESIYNFFNKPKKKISVFFESSNNQSFVLYKKDSNFFHEKIDNNDYLLSLDISHIFYNLNKPKFINSEITTSFFSLKEIVLLNLNKLDFKKNIIIKPMYISNNLILN